MNDLPHFIKRSAPPPDVKEGEELTAKIADIEYPMKGEYREQVRFSLVFTNGYKTYSWMPYYEEPSDQSALGILCITIMNLTQQPINSVSDALERLKKLGTAYAKCTGFREKNEKQYPRFKIVPNKLPPTQKELNISPTSPEKEELRKSPYEISGPTNPIERLKMAILEIMIPETVHPKYQTVETTKKKNPWAETIQIEQAFHKLHEEGKIRPKYDGLTLVGFFKADH